MQIKKRGNRQGASHRVSMSFEKSTYEALRRESEKHGYSIAEITRQVIDRSIVYGLLSDEKKPLPDAALDRNAEMQHYTLLASKKEKLIKVLRETIAVQSGHLDELNKQIKVLRATILMKNLSLALYETDDVEVFRALRSAKILADEKAGVS